MYRRLLIALAVVALMLTAFVGVTSGAGPKNFVTPLNGGEEVPPRDTQANGVAHFKLSADGTELSFKLIASNINNVVQAHIHFPGAAGVNGPVIVWLFPAPPAPAEALTPPGLLSQNGVLATGVIRADQFVGDFVGMSMDDLVAALQSGEAYVNVHTNDGVAPPNTGPGDFPGGEIRGQID
jgi:hypothetical protein